MRVAVLAPITHRLPPAGYGPWEQMAANLAKGLTDAGHEVTMFAAEGSTTPAELVATAPHPLAEWPVDRVPPDPRIWEDLHIATMAGHVATGRFDIVHSHLNVHPLGFAQFLPVPLITTLHGAAWSKGIHPALQRYRHLPFISISDAERSYFPDLNYVATVHNGIDTETFTPGDGGGEHLLFAGRMAPEKAPHLAIEVARRAGRPLKLAGMIEDDHAPYFDTQVKPFLNGEDIEYLGSLDREDLIGAYRGAGALLVPLSWDEPFGLVVAEALACGTPVVGWRRGAMPELIRPDVTGQVVDGVEGAISAVADLAVFDRDQCRKDAVTRFGIAAMAANHAAAYERAIAEHSSR